MGESKEDQDARKVNMEKIRAAMHKNVRHPANQTVANRAMQDKGYPERNG